MGKTRTPKPALKQGGTKIKPLYENSQDALYKGLSEGFNIHWSPTDSLKNNLIANTARFVSGLVNQNLERFIAGAALVMTSPQQNLNTTNATSVDPGRVSSAQTQQMPISEVSLNCLGLTLCEYFPTPTISGWKLNHQGVAVEWLEPGSLQITALNTDSFNGGYITNDQLIPCGDFSVNYSFTSLGSESNTELTCGSLFTLTIGSGNYRTITLRTETGQYVRPEGYKNKHYNLPSSIQPGTTVSVHLATSCSDDARSISVYGYISYTDIFGQMIVDHSLPKFVFKVNERPSSVFRGLRLGVTDWNRRGDISTIFHSILAQRILN